MIIIIDNYDSFTYNLYQLIAAITPHVRVLRNDAVTVAELAKLNPDAIVISPGPGTPENAGICIDVIRTLGSRIPILGVCLGHQAMGIAFGGHVVRVGQIVHGKGVPVFHNRSGIFKGLPLPFVAGRYHSLMVERDTLPSVLEVTAETKDGIIMAMKHREYPCYGLQFHPESILTPEGEAIIRQFLNLVLSC